MGIKQSLYDWSFRERGKALGVRIKGDRVSVSGRAGAFRGSEAVVIESAPRGTLARSVVSTGWQKPASAQIQIITPDGVELVTKDVKDVSEARRWVALYNSRSGVRLREC